MTNNNLTDFFNFDFESNKIKFFYSLINFEIKINKMRWINMHHQLNKL